MKNKCKNSQCPLNDKCLRFMSVIILEKECYKDWQFTIIKGNHIACSGFKTLNKKYLIKEKR